jgi:hypothetical protein
MNIRQCLVSKSSLPQGKATLNPATDSSTHGEERAKQRQGGKKVEEHVRGEVEEHYKR